MTQKKLKNKNKGAEAQKQQVEERTKPDKTKNCVPIGTQDFRRNKRNMAKQTKQGGTGRNKKRTER